MDPKILQSLVVFVIILLMVTLMVIISRMFGIKAKGSMFAPIIISSFIATVIYGIWLAKIIVGIGLGDYVVYHSCDERTDDNGGEHTARILKPGGKTTS